MSFTKVKLAGSHVTYRFCISVYVYKFNIVLKVQSN